MRRPIAGLLCTVIICTFGSTSLFGQLDTIVAKFVPRSHPLGTASLRYRLFIPDGYDPGQKYPLVLTLGGDGGDGTDNLKQVLRNPQAEFWAYPSNQKTHPCFVLAPQIEMTQEWYDEKIAMLVTSLLDSLAREFSVDTNRIYLSGFSHGGSGAWGLIVRFPNRFAAALIEAAGWGNARDARNMINTPIWCAIGAADETVMFCRAIIDSFRALGREAVYTNCHNQDCSGLSDSVVSMYVRSHADLLYTEIYSADHGGGDVLTDKPLAKEWVFDKYRITPGSIRITSPASYQALHETETLTWNSAIAGDSVEIWYSPDAGKSRRLVSRSEPNSGMYQWDTRKVGDAAFGQLKIFVKNHDGSICGQSQTGYFRVDNASSGTPFVRILNEEFTTRTVFDKDTLTLRLLTGDSKGGPVALRLFASPDAGRQFLQVGAFTAQTDSSPQRLPIRIDSLFNSNLEVLKLAVGQGIDTTSDKTYPFSKQTPRLTGPAGQHLSGHGSGYVKANVVDSTSLTGDRYRIEFNDAFPGRKFYDVVNMSRGMKVVAGATELDGVTEGPPFDGMRLLIKDYDPAIVDLKGSKWEVSPLAPLSVTISLPQVFANGIIVKGIPYGADYSVSFYDHVVDTTSSAVFGNPKMPINFAVQNLTENRRAQIAFVDEDNNRQISNQDEIYILEPDTLGSPRLTWELLFESVTPDVTNPQPGDRFVFRTLKPFDSGDVFEFSGVVASVHDRTLPTTFSLSQNWPNPFNPVTTIQYAIPGIRDQSSGLSKTTLVVYDLLGRKVATLVNEVQAPGSYEVGFDGRGLASGVYFYRLTAGSYVQSRKMILLK